MQIKETALALAFAAFVCLAGIVAITVIAVGHACAQDRGRNVGDNDRQLREKFNSIEQRRVMREIERSLRRDNSLLMDRWPAAPVAPPVGALPEITTRQRQNQE